MEKENKFEETPEIAKTSTGGDSGDSGDTGENGGDYGEMGKQPGSQVPPDNLPLPGTGTNGKPVK